MTMTDRTWIELQIELPSEAAEVIAALLGDRVGGFEIRDADTLLCAPKGRSVLVTLVPPEDEADDVQIPTLPTSLPRDSYGRLQLLHSAGLALDAGTLDEALAELELPFMFAGREQWVTNLTTADGAAADPRLWNVSMENPTTDASALKILLGRAAWAAETRGTMADDVAYWESLVPDWAPDVRDQLESEGYPFSLELLASPEVQLDLHAPLFEKGAHPASLFGLGVMQSGESAFLRSMGADRVLLELWPLYYRYHHRPAGAPVPEDLEAGLSFGTVIAESCSEETANGCIDGVRYKHSAVMDSYSYNAWAAYGMPGAEIVSLAAMPKPLPSSRGPMPTSALTRASSGIFTPSLPAANLSAPRKQAE